jgi:hypothetical protein
LFLFSADHPTSEANVRKGLSAAIVLGFLIAFSMVCQAQTGKIEPLGPLTEPKASDAVRKALDTKGYRAVLADGSVACEIWLRQSVPARASKEDVPGAIYPELAESTLVGVISFPQATTDYRGQAVRAGTYTLRYELIPDDGNHLGVAPNRDFLLLMPATSDEDPAAMYKFDQLVDMSRQSTMTKHPGPLSMVQANAGQPAVSKDDQDHWIFSASLKMSSGEVLPFGLVVKGTAPQ